MSGLLAILGGRGGIGRAVSEAAADAGYHPVILDLPASIEAHPTDLPTFPIDPSSPASLEAAVGQLPSDLEGLISLQGFMADNQAMVEISEEIWSDVLDGNLTASWRIAKAAQSKLKDGAAIVFAGSGLGHYARAGYGPYAIAKAGIAALTRQLALELAPRIRVNSVAPSAVDTAFLRGGTGRPDAHRPRFDLDAYAETIPLGRIATPEDVTGPILFLLSPAAGYMTGQTLHVNGGAYMP